MEIEIIIQRAEIIIYEVIYINPWKPIKLRIVKSSTLQCFRDIYINRFSFEEIRDDFQILKHVSSAEEWNNE